MTLRQIIVISFISCISFYLPNSHAAILKYTIAGNATAAWPGGTPHAPFRDQIADFYNVDNPFVSGGISSNVPIHVELVLDTSAVPTVLNDQLYVPGDSLDGFGEALYRDFMVSASVSLNGHVFNNIRPFATTQINEQEALIENTSIAYGYGFEFHNAHSIVGSSLFTEETIPLNGADDLDVSIGLLRFGTSFLSDSVDNVLIPSEINYQDAFLFNLSFILDTCSNDDCSLKDQVMNVSIGDINDITGFSITPVPVPAAVYLFSAGLLGFAGLLKRKKA